MSAVGPSKATKWMFPRRSRQVAAILSSLLVVLAACAPAAAPPAATGGAAPSTGVQEGAARSPSAPKRIVVGARESAPVLSNAIDGNADVVQELISSGLVRFDPRGEPVALLAEAVPSIENNLWKVLPDGRMEITWKLREGLKWHDGVPLTAEDVLFGARIAQDRELPLFGNAAFNLLDSLRATDARTIVSEWKQPYIQADSMFSWEVGLPLPRHLLEEASLNNKAAFMEHRYWSHEFIHAGPFRVREFVPTERIMLDAFDGYALGRPVVDQVEVRFIPDSNTLVANLIAGDVHFTIGPGLAVDQSLTAQERWQGGGKMGVFPYQGATVARPQFINPSLPAVLDLRFRRALYHAIDRDVLNESITRGQAPTSGFTVPPGAPEFAAITPSIVQYPFDPRRSVQLIEEMGFTRVGDTFRDAVGNELATEIQVTQGDTGQEHAVLFIADSWQRVGVRGVPKMLSPQANTREVRATRPGFEVSSFSIATRQPNRVIWFHSKDIPTPDVRFRGGNFSRYANPELDRLVDQFFVTVPLPERVEVLKQIANHATEQVIIMPLYHTVHASLISNRVSNVTPRTGQAQTWESHKWDIR